MDKNDIEALGLPIRRFSIQMSASCSGFIPFNEFKWKVPHVRQRQQERQRKLINLNLIMTPPNQTTQGKREQQDYLATLLAIQQSQQFSDDKSKHNPPPLNIEAALTLRAIKVKVTHIIDFLPEAWVDAVDRQLSTRKIYEYFNITMKGGSCHLPPHEFTCCKKGSYRAKTLTITWPILRKSTCSGQLHILVIIVWRLLVCMYWSSDTCLFTGAMRLSHLVSSVHKPVSLQAAFATCCLFVC